MEADIERFVAERNIRHYRELLAGDLERDERNLIERLLAEEEVKLDTLRRPEHQRAGI